MGHELCEEVRVAPREAPLAPGEKRMTLSSEPEVVLAMVRSFEGAPSALEDLRVLLGQEVAAPVHQLSDAGLLREIARRVHTGALELRVRKMHIPDAFPRGAPAT
jgi:hypothetical protein